MSTPKKKTKKTRQRLGRGLSALVEPKVGSRVGGDLVTNTSHNTNIAVVTEPLALEHTAEASGGAVVEIPIDRVQVNPHQPRRVFEDSAIEELAASIREHGLLQPIVVRSIENDFELIAGERRWRATKRTGALYIRAIVIEADEESSAQLALIENIQREDLNPIERASGFSLLIERFGFTQGQVAQRMGISRPGVANLLRLLDLPEKLRDLVASGQLSVGHAKVLCSIDSSVTQEELAHRVVADGWSVRLLEDHISNPGQPGQKDNKEHSCGSDASRDGPGRVASVLRDLEDRLSAHLGTRVKLQTNAKGSRGRLVIEFYDLDQFDGILGQIGLPGENP